MGENESNSKRRTLETSSLVNRCNDLVAIMILGVMVKFGGLISGTGPASLCHVISNYTGVPHKHYMYMYMTNPILR
jgi:hypothetical protein